MRAVVSLQVWFFLSLAGCVAIVAATLVVCNHTYTEMEQVRAEGSTRFNQARQSITDYQWLADNTLSANRAVNSGLIGLKEPWVWAEYLSSLIDLYTIEDFQFDFSPTTSDSSVNGVSLHSVAINIHGYLLHDGVLISLLQQLAQHAPGRWYFESIEIQRHTGTDVKLPAAGASDASHSLEFDLVLTWVMVVLPDSRGNIT